MGRALEEAGFIISEKSECLPQQALTWMGKDINLRSR